MTSEPRRLLSKSTLIDPATVRSIERGSLTFAWLVALHVMFLAGVASLIVLGSFAGFPWMPHQPPLVIGVTAVVLADCSLVAIWWSRSTWPSHLRTVLAVLGCGGMWALLAATLKVCQYHPIAAASWGVAMCTQLFLTGLGSFVLEAYLYRRWPAKRPQFSILYLILWTTVIAALMAGGRWLSESWGWTAAQFYNWEYTRHLQVLAVVDTVLAMGVLVSVRLKSSSRVRAIACGTTIAAVCGLGTWALFESQRGPSAADLVWLLGGQGLLLLAMTISAEIAQASRTLELALANEKQE